MAEVQPRKEPGEFGGVPGMYGNVDEPAKAKLKNVTGELLPHQERMALTQTDSSRADSRPSHGTGGRMVAR